MSERVYSYRNFATLTYAATMGSIALGPVYFIYLASEHGPDKLDPISIGLGIISLVGLFFTAKHLLTWANEKILRTDDEIVWVGLLGREKVRCPLDGITKGSLNMSVAATVREGSGSMAPNQLQWKLATNAGPIEFRSIISDCSELVAQLKKLSAVPEAPVDLDSAGLLVCTYHTPIMVILMLVSLVFAFAFAGTAFWSASNGFVDANGGNGALLAFGGISLVLLAASVWAGLCVFNERIVVNGEEITWRDKLGRVRVHCTASDVAPNSYRRMRAVGQGVTIDESDSSQTVTNNDTFRLETKMGEIKFGMITHCEELARRFKAMSDRRETKPDAPT